jgi:serine/threonine protein phosphatase PrpC
MRMTEDHKPSREDEQKRIRDAGGFVINNRVMGELAVSRAFGDAEFKKGIQSIIDEEGVKMPSGGGKKKDGEADEEDKNWDQPLIIAKPDVEVSPVLSSLV